MYQWIIKGILIEFDHVYLFTTLSPFYAPSKLSELFKEILQQIFSKYFQNFLEKLRDGHLWSPSIIVERQVPLLLQ